MKKAQEVVKVNIGLNLQFEVHERKELKPQKGETITSTTIWRPLLDLFPVTAVLVL